MDKNNAFSPQRLFTLKNIGLKIIMLAQFEKVAGVFCVSSARKCSILLTFP